MENFDEQLEERRLQLNKNPDDFSANYGMGKLYYDEGEEQLEKTKTTSSENEQQQFLSEGQKMWQESMPYLEKAFDVDPANKEVVNKLQSVYSQFNMHEKIKGINERIKE
jgi:tetratricopeptide (TPR) repeat protein